METVSLSSYEIQVLIGTTISGCNMSPDATFDLKAAWANLCKLGLIDRTDGLAIATHSGAAFISELLASRLAKQGPDGFVSLAVYESVVKGRQDFRRAFVNAKGIRKQDVIEMLKDRFDASGLSYDAYGESVGLSGEFIRSVLNGKRAASRSILKLLGVEVSYVYHLASPSPVLEAASSIHEAKPIAWRFQAEGCAKDCWHFAASDPTDLGMINISPLYPRPANFAGWKARLHDLTVELALIPSASKALDNAQAIVDELLEGFDDVVETEAALTGEKP